MVISFPSLALARGGNTLQLLCCTLFRLISFFQSSSFSLGVLVKEADGSHAGIWCLTKGIVLLKTTPPGSTKRVSCFVFSWREKKEVLGRRQGWAGLPTPRQHACDGDQGQGWAGSISSAQCLPQPTRTLLWMGTGCGNPKVRPQEQLTWWPSCRAPCCCSKPPFLQGFPSLSCVCHHCPPPQCFLCTSIPYLQCCPVRPHPPRAVCRLAWGPLQTTIQVGVPPAHILLGGELLLNAAGKVWVFPTVLSTRTQIKVWLLTFTQLLETWWSSQLWLWLPHKLKMPGRSLNSTHVVSFRKPN